MSVSVKENNSYTQIKNLPPLVCLECLETYVNVHYEMMTWTPSTQNYLGTFHLTP